MNHESVERIKMTINDRITEELDWKDSVIAQLKSLNDKYNILMEKLHEYEDRLDANERNSKRRAG
tara:strand:+ start:2579 stop:2773 length:195 start_codon:yes stop_codon:yes gene_type:complete